MSAEKKYIIDNAQLMAEWDLEKNELESIRPEKITLGNNKIKVHWVCKKGHHWQTTVYSRYSLKTNCPYCSGRYATKDTSLLTTDRDLAKQWDYSRNGDITPEAVKKFSHYSAWWLCEKGHSWQAKISDRSSGNGCPICAAETHSSFPEQALYYYVKRAVPSALNRYKHNNQFEADVYLPEHCVAIEYDGEYFHKNNLNDSKKEQYFFDNDIFVIRIKEGAETVRQENKLIIGVKSNPSSNNLTASFREVFKFLNENYSIPDSDDIDVERDTQIILSQFLQIQKQNSVASDLLLSSEWDYIKNEGIDPSLISRSSNRSFWWKCLKGHSWQATCNNRAKGKGCPICAGKKIIEGDNDLATTHPKLIENWASRNTIKPTEITAGSDRKVWWICSNGHEFEASPAHIVRGRGCPYCSGRKILVGFNDLASCHPELINEWDYKNNVVEPNEVTCGTTKKVFWKCSLCGFEWSASVLSRTKGSGCPRCGRESAKKALQQKFLQTQGSLFDRYPDLMMEWDWNKNSHLNPKELSAGSSEKAWWICQKCGRTWSTQIRLRTKKGCGCQSCSNKRKR